MTYAQHYVNKIIPTTFGNINATNIYLFNGQYVVQGIFGNNQSCIFDISQDLSTSQHYIYDSTVFSRAPFNIIDSSKGAIDTLSFSGTFSFYNSPAGNYYLTVKNRQCIETWSKSGGESLVNNGVPVNYNFTSAADQAFGNNLILKGSKYCLYSGDIDQDGFITLVDVLPVYNDASGFVSGSYLFKGNMKERVQALRA